MKKYLISTLTAAAALAAPAFADSLLPTLSDENVTRVSGSYQGWSNSIGNPSNISADVVGGNYASGAFNGTGWYWGLANLDGTASFDSDFSINSETSFSYAGRQNYGGEYVTAVVELSDLLGENELLTSFTISFDMESSYSEGFHAYYIDTATNIAIEFASSADTSSGIFTYTWEASSEEEYLSGDYALMFIWNGFSGGGTVTVSDLTSEYTVTTLPEPELFSVFLGIGALGLIATRRRKRRVA